MDGVWARGVGGVGRGIREKKRSHVWVFQRGALAISAGTATAIAMVWILMQHSLEIHKSCLSFFCPHFTFAGAS
jgi:hypothetical protein